MEKLLNIINIVLENNYKPKVSEISPETDLRTDIGFDSLSLAELTARIESEYGVDIFEDGFVYTVGDILKKIL